MSHWSFFEYLDAGGGSPFYEWKKEQSFGAQAWIDARVLQMQAMVKWQEKWASKYQTTDKIIELRIPFNKTQYRPLGVYAPGYSFVLLGGAIEKSKIPKDVIDAVVKRHTEHLKEPARVRRYQFD